MILLLLKQKAMHGYQLIRSIEEKTDGLWRPAPGSIYPVLKRMVAEGLIVAHHDGGRTVYQLTGKSRRGLEEFRRYLPEIAVRLRGVIKLCTSMMDPEIFLPIFIGSLVTSLENFQEVYGRMSKPLKARALKELRAVLAEGCAWADREAAKL
jgi:DNA-binding PadR family transcriptional regulator